MARTRPRLAGVAGVAGVAVAACRGAAVAWAVDLAAAAVWVVPVEECQGVVEYQEVAGAWAVDLAGGAAD